MTKILYAYLLWVPLLFALSACGQTKKKSAVKSLPLSSQWVLHYFIEQGNKRSASGAKAYITIHSDLQGFEGHGSCNSLGGQLETEGNQIAFKNMYTTEMYCDKNTVEEKFVSALMEADHYEIKGAELFLKKKSKTIMVLESYRQ